MFPFGLAPLSPRQHCFGRKREGWVAVDFSATQQAHGEKAVTKPIQICPQRGSADFIVALARASAFYPNACDENPLELTPSGRPQNTPTSYAQNNDPEVGRVAERPEARGCPANGHHRAT